jgi:hypothetical protein
MGKFSQFILGSDFLQNPICPRREGKIVFATREYSSSRKALYFRLLEEASIGLFRLIEI